MKDSTSFFIIQYQFNIPLLLEHFFRLLVCSEPCLLYKSVIFSKPIRVVISLTWTPPFLYLVDPYMSQLGSEPSHRPGLGLKITEVLQSLVRYLCLFVVLHNYC